MKNVLRQSPKRQDLALAAQRGSLRPVGFFGQRKITMFAAGYEAVVVKTVLGSHFWLVGEFTTHFRTYFSGDWDVHWGYGVLTHGHACWRLFGVKVINLS